MKRYLKNLCLALTGADPFRAELAEADERMEKAAGNLRSMQHQLYAALEKWDQTAKALEESDATNGKLLKRLGDSEKRAAGFQVLIENLRGRIREKDAEMKKTGEAFRERMEYMKQDYQRRIDDYNQLTDYVRSSRDVPYEIGMIVDRLTDRRKENKEIWI